MGMTAENLAEKYNISRQAQDEFAYHSQEKRQMLSKTAILKSKLSLMRLNSEKQRRI